MRNGHRIGESVGKSVVVIGNFDGVHPGHREVLGVARTLEPDARLIVVTFWPHPLSVVRPGDGPRTQSVSVSAVSSGESGWTVGTDRRPLLISTRANGCSCASSSTALRYSRLAGLLGVMKSVARVEFSRLSSAAKVRSSA